MYRRKLINNDNTSYYMYDIILHKTRLLNTVYLYMKLFKTSYENVFFNIIGSRLYFYNTHKDSYYLLFLSNDNLKN